jgi:ABC-type multidrug transport system fused ATPase/permease subunit
MIILLVAAAWISAFIPMPRWLSVLVSVAVLLVGTLLVVTGAMAYAWDRSMRPDETAGLYSLLAGGALLLSRARLVLRLIAEILVAY